RRAPVDLGHSLLAKDVDSYVNPVLDNGDTGASRNCRVGNRLPERVWPIGCGSRRQLRLSRWLCHLSTWASRPYVLGKQELRDPVAMRDNRHWFDWQRSVSGVHSSPI